MSVGKHLYGGTQGISKTLGDNPHDPWSRHLRPMEAAPSTLGARTFDPFLEGVLTAIEGIRDMNGMKLLPYYYLCRKRKFKFYCEFRRKLLTLQRQKQNKMKKTAFLFVAIMMLVACSI